MKCSHYNFPYKCFYQEDLNLVYSFYRQGESFTINPDKIDTARYQKIIDKDVGQMELSFGKALAVRSSGNILFFKQEYDHFTQSKQWVLYH